MSKYYGVLLTAALFLVSLATNSLHWLTEPPGIDSDAARLGLYAHDLLQEKLFPFYVYHQYAPHPLIIYVQSLVFAVLGYSNATLRGVTIVGGALATPAIYWASRRLFEDQGTTFAHRAGLIAALGLALSTFFSSYSRWGTEVRSATGCGVDGRCVLVARVSARALGRLCSGRPICWHEPICLYRSAFLSGRAGSSEHRGHIGESQTIGTLARFDFGGNICRACGFAPVDSVCHPSLYVHRTHLKPNWA